MLLPQQATLVSYELSLDLLDYFGGEDYVAM